MDVKHAPAPAARRVRPARRPRGQGGRLAARADVPAAMPEAAGEHSPRVQERRRGPADRRRVSRGDPDRRQAGPLTAVRLARMRVAKDVEWIYRNLREGNWSEVARVAGGLAAEVGSVVGSLALWPLALVGPDLPRRVTRLDAPAPRRAHASDVDRPVVLVHGWFHNRSGFLVMRRRLRALGRRHVYAVDLPTSRMGVQRLASVLAGKIDRIREITGADEVDVVAHSLGGLVARWWIQHGGGDRVVKHLVTLGAPNKGTALAAFLPIGSGRAINPGSWTLAALEAPPPRAVKVTVIGSDMDYLILPLEESAWHPGERSVRMKYVGHLSLLYSKAVFAEVWRALGGAGEARSARPRRRGRR